MAMLVAMSVTDLLANLPGHLVGHLPAHLPRDILAGLPGHLDGHLPGNLAADLPGHAVADCLSDVSDNVGALGLRDLGALWDRHQPLVLDWDLVAGPPDLSLASWGMGQDPCLTLDDGVACQLAWESPNTSNASTSNASSSNSSNSLANNWLNCHLTLHSNQSSLFAHLKK